jgi:FAD synthetase
MHRGDLYVVVARDNNVERIKQRKPIQGEARRREVLQAAFPTAHIVLGDLHDFLVPVRSVQPELVLLGYDQHLPPGVTANDLPCPIERLPAFHPEQFKSSKRTT